jgi:16S rRNA (uracil1498-N3)-methyltransferase
MPRFHCSQSLSIGDRLILPEQVAHHIQVLRMKAGDLITLFNGDGGEYTASLVTIEKKRVTVELKTFSDREAELPYAITLAQALPESSKMDWIIEKAVELGALIIQPLTSQRCVTRLSVERAAKRQAHWQGIVVAASEQCGRNRLAHLAELSNYSEWIAQQDLHRRVLLSPRAEQSLSEWARHQPPQAVALVVGPEGGFTDEEENLACKNGMMALSIGPRVLRTETAGLVALSALNAVWGGL